MFIWCLFLLNYIINVYIDIDIEYHEFTFSLFLINVYK